MVTGIVLVAALWGIVFALFWREARFSLRRAKKPPVVLRPIVIPARYGSHTFTDAEVVDRFLHVDWLLSHRDPEPARRDW